MVLAATSHEAMAPKRKSGLIQSPLPARSRPYQGRVGEQPLTLLLLGQSSERRVEGVVGVEERFLAVKDGRIVLSAYS